MPGVDGPKLAARLRRERREVQVPADRHDGTSSFVADGILVSFDSRHPAPAVGGVLYPRILLPTGIDRLLNRQELNAVLLHWWSSIPDGRLGASVVEGAARDRQMDARLQL